MVETNNHPKPLYLLADSRLLFSQANSEKFLQSLRQQVGTHDPQVTRAAYVGASNNDDPVFYELFVSAMDHIDTHESRMIKSRPSEADQQFLAEADLILLAGGDIISGWSTIHANGVAGIVRERYSDGAVIIGISAGAVQLGHGFHTDTGDFVEMLNLIPHYIDVHDEENSWQRLRTTVEQGPGVASGFGIPAGGGLIYHPDASVEPVGNTTHEISKINDALTSTVLIPGAEHDTGSPADTPAPERTNH